MSFILETGQVPALEGIHYTADNSLTTIPVTDTKWLLVYNQREPDYILGQIVEFDGTAFIFNKTQVIMGYEDEYKFSGFTFANGDVFLVYKADQSRDIKGRQLEIDQDIIYPGEEIIIETNAFLSGSVFKIANSSGNSFDLYYLTRPISSTHRIRRIVITVDRVTNAVIEGTIQDFISSTSVPDLQETTIDIQMIPGLLNEGLVMTSYNGAIRLDRFSNSGIETIQTAPISATEETDRILLLNNEILAYLGNDFVQFYNLNSETWSAPRPVDIGPKKIPLRINNSIWLALSLNSAQTGVDFGAYQYTSIATIPEVNTNNGTGFISNILPPLSGAHTNTDNFYKIDVQNVVFFYRESQGDVNYAWFVAPLGGDNSGPSLDWDVFDGSNIMAQTFSSFPVSYKPGVIAKSDSNLYYHVYQDRSTSSVGPVYIQRVSTDSGITVEHNQTISFDGDGFNGIHDFAVTSDPDLIYFVYWLQGSNIIKHKLLRWDGSEWIEKYNMNLTAGIGSGRDMNLIVSGNDWVLIQHYGSTSSKLYFITIDVVNETLQSNIVSEPLLTYNVGEDRMSLQSFYGTVAGTEYIGIPESSSGSIARIHTYEVAPQSSTNPLIYTDTVLLPDHDGVMTMSIEDDKWMVFGRNQGPGDIFIWKAYQWTPTDNILLAQNTFSSGVPGLDGAGYIRMITDRKFLLIDRDNFNRSGVRVIELDQNLSQLVTVGTRYSLPSEYEYSVAVNLVKNTGRTTDELLLSVREGTGTFQLPGLVVIKP